jgi:hypothetical protein
VSARSFEVLRSDQNEQSDTCLIFKVRCNLHGGIVESMPCLERLCVKTSLQNG